MRAVCVGPDGVAYCVICQRRASGHAYCHKLQLDVYPYYQFCSKAHQDIGVLRANQGKIGMIEKSPREQTAIKDARKNFAERLTELGLMQPFFNRTPEEIDSLIEACVDGYQRSMLNQNFPKSKEFDDEIPF